MRPDALLQREVLNELAWEPSVNASHIAVSVKDGVVTLIGYVESYAEKYAAAEAARRVDGVRAVANEIEVKPAVGGERTDDELAAAVVDALERNIFIPADKIRVTVEKGWVTLEGQVRWQFQKRAAERAVRNLRGVKGVSNLITVAPSVTPAEVKSRIEEALRRSAELDAERITVEVEGNKVILRGTVRSRAEREAAEQAAWRAPGIIHVENLITVEP